MVPAAQRAATGDVGQRTEVRSLLWAGDPDGELVDLPAVAVGDRDGRFERPAPPDATSGRLYEIAAGSVEARVARGADLAHLSWWHVTRPEFDAVAHDLVLRSGELLVVEPGSAVTFRSATAEPAVVLATALGPESDARRTRRPVLAGAVPSASAETTAIPEERVLRGVRHDDGFDVFRLMDEAQLEAIWRLYASVDLDEEHGFFVSSRDRKGEEATRVSDGIQAILGERIHQLFPSYRIVFGTICSKGRRSSNIVSYHHDPTFTDERRYRGLLMWSPLVDCDRTNGLLKVVPRSQEWTSLIRASQSWDATMIDGLAELLDDLAIAEPLWAGDALVLDGAVVHGSGPNGADALRPAVVVFLVPSDAPLMIFHRDDETRAVRGFLVDEAFFLEKDLGIVPAGYQGVDPWADAMTVEEIHTQAVARQAGPVEPGAPRA